MLLWPRHFDFANKVENGRYPRWKKYCEKAGIDCTIHQLRHAHATELVNDGVSLATIRKRLGHKNLQTTLRYAEQSDTVTDDEIRHWRRNKETH